MSKKSNMKFISLVTIFCIVIAYFAILSPTTAYYYKSENKDIDISFSLLDVTQTVSETASDVNLKAATSFYDFSENLFDDVCYEQTITLTNSGDVAAKIYVVVDVPTENATNGLRYFISKSEIASSGEELPEETTVVATATQKGSIKSEIETALTAFDSDFVDGVSFTDAETILNSYNSQFTSFEDAPLLQKGETLKLKVIFWAEYDAISSSFTSSLTLFSYAPVVTVKAAQNSSGAQPTSAS